MIVNTYKIQVRRKDGSIYYYNEYAACPINAKYAAMEKMKDGEIIAVTRIYKGGKYHA